MTPTTQTLLNQLGGTNKIAAMTGAEIVTDDKNNGVHLVFGRQVGKAGKKFTHLIVNYNQAADLYDLKALKLNKKTYEMTEVKTLNGLYGDQIKTVAEDLTGLYFTL
tara:strand:+ start:2155 stop:2475 length:321 start_codon:yes stop_codon:yes gene_type:complete